MRPTTIAIGGFSSEVGKTSLLCALLREFPGWEAIKMTRGHYRSCGKDPHACCVSDLLGDEPVIHSGREKTYVSGKDTGRYWDAGASNVHWVIVTDQQVEAGIVKALERVTAPGVFVEGNSFLDFVPVDFAVMVARPEGGKVKSSARLALPRASALYLFDTASSGAASRDRFSQWLNNPFNQGLVGKLPLYTAEDIPSLVLDIQRR
jgi:hypothetical protein